MNYSYSNYQNPYQMPMYNQPQYQTQPQQPAMQPQQQMPMQQSMTFDTPIQYVGYATLKEAEAYILMPNTKGLFIDKNSGSVYEKVCGADGQSFISHYKKVENNENKSNAEEKAVNLPEFATKTDLKGFVNVEQYEKTLQELERLKGQINGLKAMLETKSEQPKKTKAENKTNKESE